VFSIKHPIKTRTGRVSDSLIPIVEGINTYRTRTSACSSPSFSLTGWEIFRCAVWGWNSETLENEFSSTLLFALLMADDWRQVSWLFALQMCVRHHVWTVVNGTQPEPKCGV